MAECKNLDNCSFFEEYGEETSLEGFINRYCKGDKKDQCIRKMVSEALGGPENVPANMMPNGYPISGTTDDDWSEDVENVIEDVR